MRTNATQAALPEPPPAPKKPDEWKAFGLSRYFKGQTLAELLILTRRRFPGFRLDVHPATLDALTAAKADLTNVAVHPGVPKQEIWVWQGENR